MFVVSSGSTATTSSRSHASCTNGCPGSGPCRAEPCRHSFGARVPRGRAARSLVERSPGVAFAPQSLVARGAKAARALVAATGWMQVSCWRASFEAYDPLAEPAPPPRGVTVPGAPTIFSQDCQSLRCRQPGSGNSVRGIVTYRHTHTHLNINMYMSIRQKNI